MSFGVVAVSGAIGLSLNNNEYRDDIHVPLIL